MPGSERSRISREKEFSEWDPDHELPGRQGDRQRIERQTLLHRGDGPRDGEPLGAPMATEILDDPIDGVGEIRLLPRGREQPEVDRQYSIPSDRNLPGARLVGKEEDSIRVRVDLAKHIEEQLKAFQDR